MLYVTAPRQLATYRGIALGCLAVVMSQLCRKTKASALYH
jgi:hypothetical protein